MCLYVSYPLDLALTPNTISPKMTASTADELYGYPYTAGTDYSLPGNAQPNGIYAANGPHPSERTVGNSGQALGYQAEANDLSTNHEVKLDSEYQIGTSNMYVHATTHYDSFFIGEVHGNVNSGNHHYGYAVCENLRPCTKTDEVAGASCTGKGKSGFCYTSSTGTLECGVTIEIDSRWGSSPSTLPSPGRCPAGTPLVTPGKVTVPRLLIGGCMIPTDANYKPTAEIHVPEDCAVIADHAKGCLFPGATNYMPGAKQSGTCIYPLGGCMDSTALNYNPEATIASSDCILPISGCTLSNDGYNGVDTDTPAHKGRYFGSAETNGGLVAWPTYNSVLNFKSDANVLSGCDVAVEGCMDSNAVNYNPKANINGGSWCILPKVGCMMPQLDSVGVPTGVVGTAPSGDRVHVRDGGSGNFDPEATVNNKKSCTNGRLGCPTMGMFNYDPLATIDDGSCVMALKGCLDRTAINFGCANNIPNAPCLPIEAATHEAIVCKYNVWPPPAPIPAIPKGQDEERGVQVTMLATGAVEDYTAAVIQAMKERIADSLEGITADMIVIKVTPGSIILQIDIRMPEVLGYTDADVIVVENTLASEMATPTDATNFLGVQVQSAPSVVVRQLPALVPPAPPPKEDIAGAIAGGVVGGLGGILLIAFGIYYMKKKRAAKTTYPA